MATELKLKFKLLHRHSYQKIIWVRNAVLETGGVAAGEEITVILEIEMIKAQPK